MYKSPGIFERLSSKKRKDVTSFKLSDNTFTPLVGTTIEVKIHDDFTVQCLNISKHCHKISRKYYYLSMLVQILASFISGVCSFITNISMTWGITLGISSGVIFIVDKAFNWSQLQEKYAMLERSYVKLSKGVKTSESLNKFNEYKIFMESSVLDIDLV